MKKYLKQLQAVKLFDGINENEIEAILKCLDAKVGTYKKGSYVIFEGDEVKDIGIVVSGNLQIIKEDIKGSQTILTYLNTGEIFGEVIACANLPKSPVTVKASSNSEIVFIDYERIVLSCTSACEFHTKLIKNMLKLMAQKNLILNNKISYLVIKGMREKIKEYLLEQYKISNNKVFDIPLNRNELADFLNVDRSALSRELCRMRNEGSIEFWKNSFKIVNVNKF